MEYNDIKEIVDINLYEILDIDINSDKKTIKKKYKNLALKFHPDKKNGNKETFELINLAYEILINDKLKKFYDKERKNKFNNKDFIKLKKQDDIFYNNDNNEDKAKINFQKQQNEYNKKHNFNPNDINKLSENEFYTKLDDIKTSRNLIYNQVNLTKLNVSDNVFNDIFINKNIDNTNNINNEIIECNNMELSNYAPIDYNNLYSNDENNNDYYTSINQAYNINMPNDIINNYNTHNIITDNDIKNYNDTKQKHIDELNNYINHIK